MHTLMNEHILNTVERTEVFFPQASMDGKYLRRLGRLELTEQLWVLTATTAKSEERTESGTNSNSGAEFLGRTRKLTRRRSF